MLARSRQMQGKAALVSANIQRLSMRILRGGGIVLPLIEKRSGLLAALRIVVKRNAVHAEGRRGLIAGKNLRSQRWKLFQLANALIDTFNDVFNLREFPESINDGRAPFRLVPGLSEDLQSKNIVIAVNHQPGKPVALAENKPIGVTVANDPFTILPSLSEPLANQR